MPGKTKIQPVKPLQTKTFAEKPIQKPVSVNKPVQKTVQKSAVNKPAQKPVQQTKEVLKPTEQKPAAKIITKEQPKAAPKPVYNPNSPEMLKYKNNLRAKIFSKFAVGGIQGDGECSVEFSVSRNGKLENRKFSKLSDNKSLNDTVYYMLMSVPYFETPPQGYNGETIRMNFKMYNGNYEITIK